MKNSLQSQDEDVLMRFIVGDNNIPYASSYTIGYRIVREFLNNNKELTLLEWTDLEADEILEKSKYEDRLK